MRKNKREDTYRTSFKAEKTAKRKPVDIGKADKLLDVPSLKKEGKKVKKEFSKLKEELEDIIDESDDDEDSISAFQEEYEAYAKAFASDDNVATVDQLNTRFIKTTISMIMELIPIAELAYRKTQKESSAYALSNMIKQAKELTTDLKMAEDLEGQAQTFKNISNLTMRGMVQLILQEKYSLQAKVDALTNKSSLRKAFREEIDEMVKSLTLGVEEHSKIMNARMRAFVRGNPLYITATPENPDPEPEKSAPKSKIRKRKSDE